MYVFFIGNACADDLLGLSVNSYAEAYVLYNEHAFRMSFRVRKSKQRYRGETKTLLMKRFCCSMAGEKKRLQKKISVIRNLMFDLVVRLLYSLILMKIEFGLSLDMKRSIIMSYVVLAKLIFFVRIEEMLIII